MSHATHNNHEHQHSITCGHTKIKHIDHIDFIHNGHLHHLHEGHWDECSIAVDQHNSASCCKLINACSHNDECGHEKIAHGDHFDFLVNSRLEHVHGNHIDDHGAIELV